MPRPKKVDANSNAPAKVNNSQKKTISSTQKQPTANEMREWYEKNKSRLERYEDATSAITSLRDIQKSKTYTTISNYSKEDVKDYTIWLNGDQEKMDQEEMQTLQNAITRNVTTCYTLEGSYPQSLGYLKKHYGLHYDENKYFVDYQPLGANIMPDITIIRKEADHR